MTFTEALVKNFLNILVRDQVKTVTIFNLWELNFIYTATANGDGVLCGISYAGTVSVTVPAGLMTSGEAKTFEHYRFEPGYRESGRTGGSDTAGYLGILGTVGELEAVTLISASVSTDGEEGPP